MTPALFPLLALVACGDETLYVVKQDPAVSILEPYDGQQFDAGTEIHFAGVVDDDASFEELVIEWVSSIDGPLPDTDPPDRDGNVELTTASLSAGSQVITLRATDPDLAQAEDTVSIDILEVAQAPSIEVVHPAEGERGMEGMNYIFMATVDDTQDPPEELLVSLSADPGGFVCYMEIDGRGNSQCAAILPVATYLLTFTVEDLDGNSSTALANFQVVSAGDFDNDGDGISLNGGDCNDANASIYPGAPEVCDGLDNDCNDFTGIDVGSECYDDDGDGYCESPPCMNTSNTAEDCDDTSVAISPSAPEVLDTADNDCDGYVDEGSNAYDDDGDGYCESPPCVNAAGTDPDCDDTDFDVYPGATEICGDGLDNNCNGTTNEKDAIGCKNFYYDFDGDTYGVAGVRECWCDAGAFPYTGSTSTDCYDENANAYPGQRSYFTAHRGDRSFDYDCSGSEEALYTDISSGCDWDLMYFDCVCDHEGWYSGVADCGDSGRWIESCNATYDPVCYGLCLLLYSSSSAILDCLLYDCGATCDPEYTSVTQECR